MIRRSRSIGICYLRGGVGASSRFPGTFTADDAIGQIQDILRRAAPDTLVLCINCTGGAPAQAEAIFRYVKFLEERYAIRTLSFIEDFATSAGYWIACSCSEIYALDCSVIGSIGIATRTFEVSGFLKKLGVERRVYSDADAKLDLDMFSEHSETSVARTQHLNRSLEATFLRNIAQSRSGRIRIDPDEIRTGRIWTGREALEAGLVDGVDGFRTFLQADEFASHKLVFAKQPRKGKLLRLLGIS
jgi:ClpP class serine protease